MSGTYLDGYINTRANKRTIFSPFKYLLLVLTIAITASACQVKFVSDYDAKNAQAILQAAKHVDLFYTRLLNEADNKRSYARSKSDYIDIEVELRSLLMRNEIKPLNQESVKIIKTIISKWQKYQAQHKKNNRYKTVLASNHRDRFVRLFVAMSVAEEAKRGSKKMSHDQAATASGGQQ